MGPVCTFVQKIVAAGLLSFPRQHSLALAQLASSVRFGEEGVGSAAGRLGDCQDPKTKFLELEYQMTRGRKPKPNHLKLVEGNPGKRSMPKKKRHVPVGMRVPSDLSPEAKKYWKQIVKNAPLGLLRACDAQALKRYIIALCIYGKAAADLDKSSSIIRSKNGTPIHNPHLGILNRQTDILHKLESEFGFTPAARARLGFIDHDVIFGDDEDDYFFDSNPIPAHLK